MSESKAHHIMKYFVLFASISFLWGCKPEAKAIEYGKEACDYCRMSIVDERYAAQLVNTKGKSYSFDALECLLHYKTEHSEKWAMELVSDYQKPRHLIPAQGAWFLRSINLPSPMGMYLTAVANEEEAKALQAREGGSLYSYPELLAEFSTLPAL